MKYPTVSALLAIAAVSLTGVVYAQNTLGNVPTGDASLVKVPAVDKNGDGCISKDEVTPGSQLEKRFATRDANGDGKLCKDEYYTGG